VHSGWVDHNVGGEYDESGLCVKPVVICIELPRECSHASRFLIRRGRWNGMVCDKMGKEGGSVRCQAARELVRRGAPPSSVLGGVVAGARATEKSGSAGGRLARVGRVTHAKSRLGGRMLGHGRLHNAEGVAAVSVSVAGLILGGGA
jgi:hypothetical protein